MSPWRDLSFVLCLFGGDYILYMLKAKTGVISSLLLVLSHIRILNNRIDLINRMKCFIFFNIYKLISHKIKRFSLNVPPGGQN